MSILHNVIIGVFFALVVYVNYLFKQVAAGIYAPALIRGAGSIANADQFGIDERAQTAADHAAAAVDAGRRNGTVRTAVSS